MVAVLTCKLNGSTGASTHLGTSPRSQLHAVQERTDRNVGKRKAVARLDLGVDAAHDGVANIQLGGSDDVALLAVLVMQQCNPR